MITSVVGRTFLNAYNKKYNKQLNPKEFFVDEYFELFYNHPKYLQWVTNSPFVQMKGEQNLESFSEEEKIEKIEYLIEKVNSKELSILEFVNEEYFDLLITHPLIFEWQSKYSLLQNLEPIFALSEKDKLEKIALLQNRIQNNVSNEVILLLNEFFDIKYFDDLLKNKLFKKWAKNSPFFVLKPAQKVHLLSNEDRLVKLNELKKKVNSEAPDASFALGFPASESKEFASTSGLVSDIKIPSNEDEIYLSWIGSGLGIGVAGGYTILFDDPQISLLTYEGWKVYRKYLNDKTLNLLRGNQIGTWNGQWLSYSLHEEFDENFDFGLLTDEKIFSIDAEKIEVNTVNWAKLFFSLSQLYPDVSLTAYVYGFGQTNKTIGFIPFQLKSGTSLKRIYKQLVGSDSAVLPEDFESLFGMHIKRACELGSIGLQTLRPEGLVKYMNDGKNLNITKEEDKINYYVFKTWLIAMLSKNKEEVTEYTLELAETILKYRNGDSNNKTTRKNLVEKELFESKSKKGFIEHLTTIIKDLDKNDLQVIKSLKDEIHLMTNEEFGYFTTLLKFDYAFLEKQS